MEKEEQDFIPNNECMVLYNIFTKEECDAIILTTIKNYIL